MNIQELLIRYRNYLEHERKFARNTVAGYLSDLRALARAVQGDVAQISLADLRSYQRSLSESGLAARTIQRKFAGFTTFWRWLRLEGLSNSIVTEGLLLPKVERKLPTWLSADELARFAMTTVDRRPAILALRDQTAWQLLAWLGLRRSEVLNLSIEDVLLDAGVVIIRRTKTKRDRALPLPDTLKLPFEQIIGDRRTGYVFGIRGGRWTPSRFSEAFGLHLIRCGLTDRRITPHTIRHSFATHLVEQGVNVTDVQALLGHVDLKSTMVYVHVESSRLRAALSCHVLNEAKH